MVLEMLFRGNLIPGEMVHPQGEEYMEANCQVCEMEDKLNELLNENEKTLLKELMDKMSMSQLCECESYFKLGFSLGMRMYAETEGRPGSV